MGERLRVPGQRPEWELELSQRWHHDPNLRQRADDYPVEVSDAEILPQMFAGVGGSTLHFGGHFPRLLPSDFRVRSARRRRRRLADLLRRLAAVLRADRHRSRRRRTRRRPGLPPGAPPPLPPHPINAYGRKAAEGMNALGWHWWPAPNAIASRDWGNLERCARYGTCETGCPTAPRRASTLRALPGAASTSTVLLSGCSTCHKTLEPMAAYFARINEADWTFWPSQFLPASMPSCLAAGRTPAIARHSTTPTKAPPFAAGTRRSITQS